MTPLLFARIDRALLLAPDLFRSLPRDGRTVPLAIDYQYGKLATRFTGPSSLGCGDLRTMMGIAALAAVSRRHVSADPNPAFADLRRAMVADGNDGDGNFALVACGDVDLASAAGYARDGGGALRSSLRASLDRLSRVRVDVVGDGFRSSTQLLAWDRKGAGRTKVRIALNARSSQCATGNIQYTRIDLVEARDLTSDPGRLLHAWLSAWVDAGKRKSVGLDRLAEVVWGTAATVDPSPGLVSQRRASLRRALEELRSVGWDVGMSYDGGAIEIARPRRRDVEADAGK